MDKDEAVAAASPDLTQWGSEASSSAETGGDEYPAGCDAVSGHATLRDEAQLRDTLMFIDGGSPRHIKKYVVDDPEEYELTELQGLINSQAAFPILCGFNCTDDVEYLAEEHTQLTRSSISRRHLSWHLLVDSTRWQITKPLEVELIMGGDRTGHIERYAAVCELQRTGVNATQPLLRIASLKCVRGKAAWAAWHVTQETRTSTKSSLGLKPRAPRHVLPWAGRGDAAQLAVDIRERLIARRSP